MITGGANRLSLLVKVAEVGKGQSRVTEDVPIIQIPVISKTTSKLYSVQGINLDRPIRQPAILWR
eukprot:6472488-Amphidinium_carterae.1